MCLFGVAVKDVCQTYKEKDLLDCQQYQNLAETTLTEILAKQGKDKSLIKSWVILSDSLKQQRQFLYLENFVWGAGAVEGKVIISSLQT